jgi:hypothetical protein
MPEEIEVPTEHLQETLHEAAGGHGGESGPSWVSQVALTAAVLAVAAAITALLAGHHANEAMLEQMKATDEWAYYQAKGIKGAVTESKLEILAALGKEAKADEKKFERYKEEQEKISAKAEALEQSSERHMDRHTILARAVTAYQVAIALSAIAVLSRKKVVWFVSLALGAIGTVFLVQALLPLAR